MDIDSHGGGCCGIFHLSEFDEDHDADEMTFKDKVEAIQYSLRGIERRLVEAVLADYQFKNWERALQKVGFRLKTRFRNGNTNRNIRVYHLVK